MCERGNRKYELVFLGTFASAGKKETFHLYQQKQKDPLPGLDAHPHTHTRSSRLNNGLWWEPDEPTLELSHQSTAGREMSLYSAHWCLWAELWPCSSNRLPPQQPGCAVAHISFLLLLRSSTELAFSLSLQTQFAVINWTVITVSDAKCIVQDNGIRATRAEKQIFSTCQHFDANIRC